MQRSHVSRLPLDTTTRSRPGSVRPLCLLLLLGLPLVAGSIGATVPRLSTEPRSILAAAQNAENQIVSGRVALRRIEENQHQNEVQIRRLIRDPAARKIEMFIAKHKRRRVIETVSVTFDNRRHQVLLQKEGDGPLHQVRVLFDQKSWRTYTKQTPPSGKESPELRGDQSGKMVSTMKPRWPAYWPYDLLQGRFWSGLAAAVEKGELHAQFLGQRGPRGQTLVLLMTRGDLQQKIWVDTERAYSVPRIQYLTQTGHLKEEIFADYQRLPSGIWYPTKLVDSHFSWADDGSDYHFRSRIATTLVQDVSLNVPLDNKELEFGDIPQGALVQDDRFTPPLSYTQDNRQFTDKELFQLARNRNLLEDPTWSGNAPPTRSLALTIGGVLLIVGALFLAKRKFPQRDQS
jgi:hypothetical protein